MTSSDPDDHYNDSPSDHPYGFNVPERCVACRQLYPCTTILADKPDAAAQVESLRFWRKECRCSTEWGTADDCPLHEPCDEFCGAARDPGEDVPELQRALQHAREHHLWGGCSHGD
jgi:hypothetical protein